MQDCRNERESRPTAALEFAPAFIHSALDDYGLTMAQFRLFCHIARRGDCYESVPKMAKHCRMREETAYAALKFLEDHSLVFVQRRQGQSSVLSINRRAGCYVRRDSPPGGKEGGQR